MRKSSITEPTLDKSFFTEEVIPLSLSTFHLPSLLAVEEEEVEAVEELEELLLEEELMLFDYSSFKEEEETVACFK